MTRSVAWLLAAALGLPSAALAQSSYHVRIPTLKISAKQDKDKGPEKDKEKPKDLPKEKDAPKDEVKPKEKDAPKDEGKGKEKDGPKDPAPEAPAARPVLYPANPYPPPAPAVRDPRFMAWQQVFPGPGAPPHVEIGAPGAAPVPHVVGVAPVEAPLGLAAPPAQLPVGAPAPVVAPLPLPEAPVAAPATTAPGRPGIISIRGKKEGVEGERTIDIVRDGRKGWRVSDGPR